MFSMGEDAMKKWAMMVVALAVVGCNEECPSKGKSQGKTTASESSGGKAGVVEGRSVVLNVQEMMCAEGCGKKVEGILAKAPGVKQATVDFEAKEARLTVDEGTFDASQVVAELKTAGYPSEVVSGQK